MDPNKSTREEYTNAMVVMPVPEFASPQWKKYVRASQVLLDKLAHHSAMAPNLQQTYMTPANSKNKVYFEWDFVGRTLVSSRSVRVQESNTGILAPEYVLRR